MPCIRYVAREYFDRMRTDEHVDELVTTNSLDRGGGVHPMIIEQGMINALVDVPVQWRERQVSARALTIQRAARLILARRTGIAVARARRSGAIMARTRFMPAACSRGGEGEAAHDEFTPRSEGPTGEF